MAKAQKSDKTLADLLDHAMKDIYYAERKIHRTLPKIIKACSDARLAEALSKHRDETSEQITLLESAFELLGKPAKAVRCEAICNADDDDDDDDEIGRCGSRCRCLSHAMGEPVTTAITATVTIGHFYTQSVRSSQT